MTTINGFTGATIELFKSNKKVCNISSITFQTTREMAPIYTMGSDPRQFRRRRAIAGSAQFEEKMDLERVPIQADEIRMTAMNEHGDKYFMQILDIEFLSKTRDTFLAKTATAWRPITDLKCECGAESCGYSTHSHWCPRAI